MDWLFFFFILRTSSTSSAERSKRDERSFTRVDSSSSSSFSPLHLPPSPSFRASIPRMQNYDLIKQETFRTNDLRLVTWLAHFNCKSTAPRLFFRFTVEGFGHLPVPNVIVLIAFRNAGEDFLQIRWRLGTLLYHGCTFKWYCAMLMGKTLDSFTFEILKHTVSLFEKDVNLVLKKTTEM